MSSTVKRGCKREVYLTPEQKVLAAKAFGCDRFVYNKILEFESKLWHHIDKIRSNPKRRDEILNKLKAEYPWLYEVNGQMLQQSKRKLDAAWKNFFDSVSGKRPDKVGKPTLHKKKGHQSARFVGTSFKFEGGVLTLGGARSGSGIGSIPILWHRRVVGIPSSVVLSINPSGKYFVSFQVAQPLRLMRDAKNFAIAIDLNTKAFYFHNGRKTWHVDLPRPLRSALSRLRTAQKHFNRCKKGSANREKARIRVAKIYQKVLDIRTDFLQKLSTQLVRDNQVILIESLRVKNMLKSRSRARILSDATFGEFVRMLKYKCQWYGRVLVQIGTFFPSSKLCCRCHIKNAELEGQDRWTCPNCGAEHQRDENAAVNIFVEGLRILAEGRSVSACGVAVRPEHAFRQVPVKQELSLRMCSNA